MAGYGQQYNEESSEESNEEFLRDLRDMIDENAREQAAKAEREFDAAQAHDRAAAMPDTDATRIISQPQTLPDVDATVIYRPQTARDGDSAAAYRSHPQSAAPQDIPDFELPEDLFNDIPDLEQEEAMQQPSTEPSPRSAAPIKAYNSDYVKSTRAERGRRSVSDDTEYVPHRAQQAEELPEEAPPRKKKKKRHGFLRFLLVLVLILAALAAVIWFLLPKQPDGAMAADKRSHTATVLVAGTDKDGYRTDTMLLVYVDMDAKELNLLSIPRDTHVSVDGTDMKLNAVYGYGGCGEEGMELLLRQMRSVIGYEPDGYVLMDFDGVAKIVDAMGGIEFDVPCDMYYSDPSQDLLIDLQAGLQSLDGEEAVQVMRYRSGYAMADLQRVNVQRDLLSAAMDQWLSVKKLPRCLRALTMLGDCATTNLSTRNVLWLGKAAMSIGMGQMQSATLPGEWSSPYYWLYTGQSADLINESFNPLKSSVSSEDLR